MNVLLSRDKFRESVFKRDYYKCIICNLPPKDAHHIIDRKCFNDGGYYIDNGVSLCEEHHYDAEKGLLTCDVLRLKSGIMNIILPPEFDTELNYDKWGKIIMKDNKFKYPRTSHFEFSKGVTSDDKIQYDLSNFIGKEVIMTLKMDGENSSLMSDCIYARSLDSNNHPSRNWLKGLWGNIRYNIPENWRICGENLFAKHSLKYDNLSSYFMVFNIWNDKNICLSWNDTLEWCELLGLEHVPVIYRGVFDLDFFKNFKLDTEINEGFVVRLSESFTYENFNKSVIKYVRKNHIQTDQHWSTQEIIKNNLKN